MDLDQDSAAKNPLAIDKKEDSITIVLVCKLLSFYVNICYFLGRARGEFIVF